MPLLSLMTVLIVQLLLVIKCDNPVWNCRWEWSWST